MEISSELAFNLLSPKRFRFLNAWVSLENVTGLIRQGLEDVGIQTLDVLSLDLDGNDYYLVREILSAGILPKLFILEYNAKFPPPIKWTIEYDVNHVWDVTDYQGASLAAFAELLSEFCTQLFAATRQRAPTPSSLETNNFRILLMLPRAWTISSSNAVIRFSSSGDTRLPRKPLRECSWRSERLAWSEATKAHSGPLGGLSGAFTGEWASAEVPFPYAGPLDVHWRRRRTAAEARLYLLQRRLKPEGRKCESILAGHKAEFTMPNELVDLAAHADKVLRY